MVTTSCPPGSGSKVAYLQPAIHDTLQYAHSDASALLEALENCEDETEQVELLEQILQQQDRQADTIDACVHLSLHLEAEIEATASYLKSMQDKLKKRIAQLQGWKSRMDESILAGVDRGVLPEKMVGTQGKIHIQFNPPRCELLVEPDELPERFQRIKVEADLAEINRAYNAHEDISEYANVTRKRRVVYKLGAPVVVDSGTTSNRRNTATKRAEKVK